MKQREINVTGIINKDGKIEMYMGELKAFAHNNKNARIVATFRIYNPGTSAALKGYYYNYIVPTIRRALWELGDRKTLKDTEQWLRCLSPITVHSELDPSTGLYNDTVRDISDLDSSEMVEHIEYIRQMAAEELNVYIDDPNVI